MWTKHTETEDRKILYQNNGRDNYHIKTRIGDPRKL